ncbi:MAG: histidinol dehydrogenase [Acidimicrobiia bacterium]|nr:histidinol dehydrogenase [Acidimicrobiia bacterium]
MDIRRIDLTTHSRIERSALTRRSVVPDQTVREQAASIVQLVAAGGDAALWEAGRRYGGGPSSREARIPPDRIAAALTHLPPATAAALEGAIANIRAVHEQQRPRDHLVAPAPGVEIARVWSPLGRVGVYAPGGRAAYPSSVLMGVIPAQVAGVESIAVASPVGPDGRLNEATLGASALLGIDEVYAMGGAQAIAALAHGTETIAPVDKIVGPGNDWVTAAKLAVFGVCGIDLPAGPSEALVLTDGSANSRIVAVDLLCQAEHGVESPVVLLTTAPDQVPDILAAAEAMLLGLERSAIIRAALEDHGLIAIAPDLETAIAFSNDFAPEHLSVHTGEAPSVAKRLTSAGSVFVGEWAPESAGDYATGANHVLPTGGLARSYGPLSVEDFGSWRQVQELTRAGLSTLRPIIEELAAVEGLTAHRLAVQVRFEEGR